MNSSTHEHNRYVKSEQRRREIPDALYRSALVLCAPTSKSRPRQWKRKAINMLRKYTASKPGSPKAHALLAYIHYLSGAFTEAETLIRRALRLEANNGIYLRLLLSVLLALEKDALCYRWLLRLAKLESFDLTKLKKQLRESNFPTDTYTLVLNAFPNGIGWFESYLLNEVEQIKLEEDDKSFKDYEQNQEIVRLRLKKFDARKVPRDLRNLIPLAQEWGIGDDAARGYFVARASMRQKGQLRKLLSVNMRRRINDWLNLFAEEAVMTDEAACFMYLLEAYEELTN